MAVQEETGPVLVTVYCDECGIEETHDYLVPAGQDSLAVARRHLNMNLGWETGARADLCPACLPTPAATNTESTREV
ncbi:hypothetical protein [Arthrobacter sp. zg-Y1110]|uniref:hypothetical protein n=1 Tax=Arthrobacter sp. zg-Y1110 TaxID=2886932 RepID=UPI001D13D66A|nr:hypothetical protein [Arthrobacter sp. zg-Y1110]MCC3292974.1 hypothetical protein [Arthrobacter sp. zg-Y1110]UWX86913.1 hypothetical protein N2K99_18895 [Arthrobacter sp. zg-Y1110]